MQYRHYLNPTLGSDPEVFLRNADGTIVGSHELLGDKLKLPTGNGHIAKDGVQLELQPGVNHCRQTSATYLLETILHAIVQADSAKLKVTNDAVIELTDAEWEKLPDEAKVLGCQPSANIYGDKPIEVPKDWKIRSGGGHLHFGMPPEDKATAWSKIWWEQGVERQVALWDMTLGVMSVLLDRSDQSIRRQAYGRAGEYRRQPHGIEYRVLSNFWLRSYTLWSLVTGMARTAMNIHIGEGQYDPAKKICKGDPLSVADIQPCYFILSSEIGDSLLALSTPAEVQEIINSNSYDKARELWEKIREWAAKVGGLKSENDFYVPITARSLDVITWLAEDGIDKHFPNTWTKWQSLYGIGASSLPDGWEKWAITYHANHKKERAA